MKSCSQCVIGVLQPIHFSIPEATTVLIATIHLFSPLCHLVRVQIFFVRNNEQ